MRDFPTKILLTDGEVINALRISVGARLDIERRARNLTHKDMLAFLRLTPANEKLSYATYIQAYKGTNNPTLKVIAGFAAGLQVSISDFFYGIEDAPVWTRVLDYQATLDRLAFRLEAIRVSLNINHLRMIEHIGLSGVTYVKIRGAKHNVSIDTIAVLAKAFGLSPTEFLYTAPLDAP